MDNNKKSWGSGTKIWVSTLHGVVLMLTFWTIITAALTDTGFFNGVAAHHTGLVDTAIDIELLLKITRFAVTLAEIP